MTEKNKDIWLTKEQLLETFGLKIPYQARLRSEGKIPFSKRNGLIRYNKASILKWFENAEQPTKGTL